MARHISPLLNGLRHERAGFTRGTYSLRRSGLRRADERSIHGAFSGVSPPSSASASWRVPQRTNSTTPGAMSRSTHQAVTPCVLDPATRSSILVAT
jgi:hypothetical protein